MLTTALTALLSISPSALADDLELGITLASRDGVHQRAVTLHDVTPGKQTGLLLELPSGERYLFALELELLAKPDERVTQQVMMSMELSRLEGDDDEHEVATVISSPRVITTVDQPAMVQQGATEDDGAGGTRLREGLKIEMVYKTR